MFRFPFTNFHELNLDWILSVVKEAKEVFDNGQESIDYAVSTSEEAKQIAEQAAERVIPDNAVTSSKIANGAVTAEKMDAGLLYRPNLLDNWYFAHTPEYNFPINQKGQTLYTNQGTTIDRLTHSNDRGGVYVTDSGLEFYNDSDGVSDYQFEGDYPPDSYDLTGSVLTNHGLFAIVPGTQTTLPSGIIIYFTAARKLRLRIPAGLVRNNSETFIAAKVEIGKNSTLAYVKNNVWMTEALPDYSETLMKCQRYLFPIQGIFRCRAAFVGTDNIQFAIPCPLDFATGTGSEINILNPSMFNVAAINSATPQTDFTFAVLTRGGASSTLVINAVKTAHGLTDAQLYITASANKVLIEHT